MRLFFNALIILITSLKEFTRECVLNVAQGAAKFNQGMVATEVGGCNA
jgi:hypothetical protein